MKTAYIQLIIEGIAAAGVVVLGLGYLFSQFIIGRNSHRKEELDTENSLTTFLKNQIDGFKELIALQNNKIEQLGKELAATQATITEKDKTIKTYFDIIQNRNPELENVLSQILDFMKKINEHMESELKITSTVSH